MGSSAKHRQEAAQRKAEKKLSREPIVFEFDMNPAQLRFHGPIITTHLTITQTHRDALSAAGATMPNPIACRFLVDTGASNTVVKHDFATRAGLKLINDNAPLHGVGVDTTGKAYIGRLLFGVESKVMPGTFHEIYVDTEINAGKLDTNLFDGLIGRDVLQHFRLTCDGKTGRMTMVYHRPSP